MKKTVFPQDQNFWYLQRPDIPSLRSNKKTEIVVIGGGMAGLTTAQAFAQKGKQVILLEAYYCGAGASGKSSGFITPNGELGLSDFIDRYGTEGGKIIWDAIEQHGVEHIRKNIKNYQLNCNYIEEDSLVVANSPKDFKKLLKESEYLSQFGYRSDVLQKDDIPSVLGSEKYYGGVTYAKSFGINAYKYCQEMKQVLLKQGIEIYEETPVLSFTEHEVKTLHATIQADYIVVCADRFIPTFNKLKQKIYHVQNFLLLSQVLSEQEIRAIFPQKNLMIWDTDLIYSFYRMTGNRFLIGGGSMLNVYDRYENHHSPYMHAKLTNYVKNIFPHIEMQFEQMWPGLIGISKDVAPISGPDKNAPSIYYIGAAAGLPVAAMLGNYCADHIIDDSHMLKDYFSPYRSFPVGGVLQSVLGTKVSFAVSDWITHAD